MQIHISVDAIKRITLRQKVSPNALRFLDFILYTMCTLCILAS